MNIFPSPPFYLISFYLGDYTNNTECEWRLSVPEGLVIELTFGDNFSIEYDYFCRYDYVKFFDSQDVIIGNGRSVIIMTSTDLGRIIL